MSDNIEPMKLQFYLRLDASSGKYSVEMGEVGTVDVLELFVSTDAKTALQNLHLRLGYINSQYWNCKYIDECRAFFEPNKEAFLKLINEIGAV